MAAPSNSDTLNSELRTMATTGPQECLVPNGYRARLPGPYRPESSWDTWSTLFALSLKSRKITTDEDRKITLCQEVGELNFELLMSLLRDQSLEDATYQQCLDVLRNHYSPKKLLIAERYRLMNTQQAPGQTLGQFYAQLQKAAKDCAFDKVKDFRDAQVTMVFIGNISCMETRKRLLEKESLTSKEALELSEAFQRVASSAPHLKEASNNSASIGKINERHGHKPDRHPAKFRNEKARYTNQKGQAPTHHATQFRDKRNESRNSLPQVSCFCCGKTGHRSTACSLKQTAVCSKCNKKGHLAVACHGGRLPHQRRKIDMCEDPDMDGNYSYDELVDRVTRRNRRYKKSHTTAATMPTAAKPLKQDMEGRKVQEVETCLEPALTNPLDVLARQDVGTLSSEPAQSKHPTIKTIIVPSCNLPISMNGQSISCELDTGACISIINMRVWQAIGSPKLETATSKATAYNGTPLPFAGQCRVKVEFRGRQALMNLHVLARPGRALCGRDMIRALNIDCGPHVTMAVNGTKPQEHVDKVSTNEALTRILNENATLFTPGLGRCTTITATLKLKDNQEITPKFVRPRPVPYALRPKVEEKLNEMVANGTVTQIEHSPWATPLVVVPKPGNNVRICGDYKVTINPVLDINQHPLPVPEDLFHQLNGGQKFSKMDLSDAYMQVELDEQSKVYTTINTPKGLFRYNRLPFGVASAPAIFQKAMETTLGGLDQGNFMSKKDKAEMSRLKKRSRDLEKKIAKISKDQKELLRRQSTVPQPVALAPPDHETLIALWRTSQLGIVPPALQRSEVKMEPDSPAEDIQDFPIEPLGSGPSDV